MKRYVLDTDHVSLFQREHRPVVARIGEKSPEQLAVTIVTAEEQFKGWLAQIKKATSSHGQHSRDAQPLGFCKSPRLDTRRLAGMKSIIPLIR